MTPPLPQTYDESRADLNAYLVRVKLITEVFLYRFTTSHDSTYHQIVDPGTLPTIL
jgi:hypothetical protein